MILTALNTNTCELPKRLHNAPACALRNIVIPKHKTLDLNTPFELQYS